MCEPNIYDDRANENFENGMNLLRKGNISKAEECFLEALKWKLDFDKAKFVLREIQQSKKWSVKYFCSNCGKLITPETDYPHLTFGPYCPSCGFKVNMLKEEIIALFEFLTKIVAFGAFLPVLIIFCCIPFPQATLSGILYLWNPLLDGIFCALSFTPIITITLLLINDPWGFSLKYVYGIIFDFIKGDFTLRFFTSISLLFAVLYVYFFLLLTPFIAVHRKGLWKEVKHQKRILFYTALFSGFIIIIRVAARIFY